MVLNLMQNSDEFESDPTLDCNTRRPAEFVAPDDIIRSLERKLSQIMLAKASKRKLSAETACGELDQYFVCTIC